jgi:DNA-binding response OmpR family regulator
MATRILVVEDDGGIRKIVVSMLKAAGYECQEAGDGLEAITMLDRVKDKYPDIPVVIVTSLYETSVVLTAMRNSGRSRSKHPGLRAAGCCAAEHEQSQRHAHN